MTSTSSLQLCFFVFFFAISTFNNEVSSQTALFVFGDSLFDPGNNDYINTSKKFKSNFPPYGETFFKKPTGRVCDGRIIPDFIAEKMKLPLIKPYLQPGNQEFSDGANFASAGAGVLVESNKKVMDLRTQLKNFEKLVKEQLGGKEGQELVKRAIYLIGVGTNDYTSLFFKQVDRTHPLDFEEVSGMVIRNLTAIIKKMYGVGARKFGFVNVGPWGCNPFLKMLIANNKQAKAGTCSATALNATRLHNTKLSESLQGLKSKLTEFSYSILDLYASLRQMMVNPTKYGFKDGQNACCGSGLFNGNDACGGREGKKYELCKNPGEYVYFDSFHPTEKAYKELAQMWWSGAKDRAQPYNLQNLFEN